MTLGLELSMMGAPVLEMVMVIVIAPLKYRE